MAKNKKPRKKYVKRSHFDALPENSILKSFMTDHSTFIAIDNLLHMIRNKGEITYKIGAGYVMKNELGEEVHVIESLNNWCDEWQQIVNRSQAVGYDDTNLRKISVLITARTLISDAVLDGAEKEVNYQRKLYRTLNQTKEGRQLIRDVVEPRETVEEIKKFAGVMAA